MTQKHARERSRGYMSADLFKYVWGIFRQTTAIDVGRCAARSLCAGESTSEGKDHRHCLKTGGETMTAESGCAACRIRRERARCSSGRAVPVAWQLVTTLAAQCVCTRTASPEIASPTPRKTALSATSTRSAHENIHKVTQETITRKRLISSLRLCYTLASIH